MNYTDSEIKAKMQDIHDKIKSHPFRYNFDKAYIKEYKRLLYQLSEVWGDYGYRVSHKDCGEEYSEEELRVRRYACSWIHNYRQELQTYYSDTFPMRWFDFYERILQMTHIYLQTGEIKTFWSIEYLWSNDKRLTEVEEYSLVTKEDCGIDSPMLPFYFPLRYSVVSDEELMWESLNDDYTFRNWNEDKQKEYFERWKQGVQPILEWVNAQHDETEFKHGVWKYRMRHI